MNRKEYELLFRLKAGLDASFKTGFGNAEKNMKALREAMKDTRNIAGKVDRFGKQSAALAKVREETKKLTKEYDTLKTEIKATDEPTKKQTDALARVETRMAAAAEKTKAYEKNLKEIDAELKNAGVDTNKLADETRRLDDTYKKLAQHQKSIASIDESIARNKAAASETRSKLMKTAAVTIAAGTAAYRGVINPAAGFEEQMSAVKAISGASDVDMARLSAKARKEASTSRFMAKDAGKALEYMALAGWKTEAMLEGLPGIMNLAAAAGEDLGMVSDIVTDSITAFNLTAADSNHFADVLAATAANSNTNIAKMGDSFKYAAPLAGAFGFEVEDTALLIGLMANAGIKSSMSGTAMRRVLSALSKDLEIAQANGEAYTVTTTNADGSMRKLRDIADELRTAFNGMSESEKTAAESGLKEAAEELGIELIDENGALKDNVQLYEEASEAVEGLTASGKVQEAQSIAGKFAMAGLLAIVNASEDDYNKLKDAIDNCDGAAEKMAQTRLDNYKGQLLMVKSALEELAITLGNQFLPQLTEGAKGATDLILRFTDWARKNPEQVNTIIRTVGAVAGLRLGMLGLKLAYLQTAKPILEVIKKVREFKAIMDKAKIAKNSASAGSALAKFGLDAGKLGPAIGIAVIALAAVGVALYKLHEDAKRADLEKRFGNISMTMEEIDRAARKVVTNKNVEGAAKALDAFSNLDASVDNLKSIRSDIEKIHYGVSVGMELDEDQVEDLKRSVDSYYTQLKEIVRDQGFALKLGLEALDESDPETLEAIDQTHARLGNIIDALGNDIGTALSKSFVDGVFNIDEYQLAAAGMEKLSNIEKVLNEARTTTQMQMLEMEYKSEYGAGRLTAESAMQYIEKLSEIAIEAEDNVRATIDNELSNLNAAVAAAKLNVENAEPEQLVSAMMDLKTLETKRDAVLKKYMEGGYMELLAGPGLDALNEAHRLIGESFPEALIAMSGNLDEAADAIDGMERASRDNLKKIMGYTNDLSLSIKNLRDNAKNAGQVVPESINLMADKIERYEAVVNYTSYAPAQRRAIKQYSSTKELFPSTTFNAAGTPHTTKTFVAGEKGAELITAEPGLTVYNAEQSARIIGAMNKIQGGASGTFGQTEYHDNIRPAYNISYNPQIYAAGLSKDEIESMLKRSGDDLIKKLDERERSRKINEMRRKYA